MKINMHQPLHFPYLGFFQKMKEADLFILLDDVKFVKNEFYNRNRFKNKSSKDEWFTVPVERDANSMIFNQVKVSSDPKWKKKLIKQMNQNFGGDFSHFYLEEYICNINMTSIRYLRNKLGIDTPLKRASDYFITSTSSQRLVDICHAAGATEYISGPHGKDYLDEKLFGDIKVTYFEPNVPDYYTALTHI